jgi:hypothetical protein
MSYAERKATPLPFRDLLLNIARSCAGQELGGTVVVRHPFFAPDPLGRVWAGELDGVAVAVRELIHGRPEPVEWHPCLARWGEPYTISRGRILAAWTAGAP